jgi:uncharacterized repeat protein (TIGR03803 family)
MARPAHGSLLSNSRSSIQVVAGRHAFVSSYKVIASFTGADGEYPISAPIGVNGTLYGTTSAGGKYGFGTVYKVTTSGALTIIHNFAGGDDGAVPYGRLLYEKGNLYGTTSQGGKSLGTAFEIGLLGGEHILHDFGSAGGFPEGGLAFSNGALYGTTSTGGAYGGGSVFEMTAAGAFKTLHYFGGVASDGQGPIGDLLAVNGSVYGTTVFGGYIASKKFGGGGTVFVVNASGRTQILHMFDLYNFAGGVQPYSGLALVNGLLYGTTLFGGLAEVAGGGGLIYSITSSGTTHAVYDFGSHEIDGLWPRYGSLASIGTTIYGATTAGGEAVTGYAGTLGAVFSHNTTSGVETVLHVFSGSPDGADPASVGLANINGTLYGTTSLGGKANLGTIFAIKP